MNLTKIGTYIKEKRKEIGMTQQELATRLHVTDRAVSKWEVGRGMPDTTIMRELCELLGITLNELLNGESIPKEEQAKKAEEQIVTLLEERQNGAKSINIASWLFIAITAVEIAIMIGAMFLLIPNFADIGAWRIVGLIAIIIVVTSIGAEVASQVERRYLSNLKRKEKDKK